MVGVEPLLPGYKLSEFNDGYPKELTDRDRCPACYSTNVLVGSFVLECCACGWSYLNKYPCDVCGKPSTSAGGYKTQTEDRFWHRCGEHGDPTLPG